MFYLLKHFLHSFISPRHSMFRICAQCSCLCKTAYKLVQYIVLIKNIFSFISYNSQACNLSVPKVQNIVDRHRLSLAYLCCPTHNNKTPMPHMKSNSATNDRQTATAIISTITLSRYTLVYNIYIKQLILLKQQTKGPFRQHTVLCIYVMYMAT